MIRPAPLLLVFAGCASAFAPPGGGRHASASSQLASIGGGAATPAFLTRASRPAAIRLRMADGDDDDEAPKKRGRRRRKDGRTAPGAAAEESPSEPPSAPPAPEPETAPEPEPAAPAPIEKDTVVKMEVLDVRDALSGKTASASIVSDDEDEEDEDEEEEDDDDDDEYEWVYVDEDDDEEDDDDSGLESLLADAKRMRSDDDEEDESAVSIPGGIKEVISTIVTVDFFVVCGLLLWFLAGIFCSYIVKDDTVQIAFNNIFEPVVQPALGVLMIGSVAGAVVDKDEF